MDGTPARKLARELRMPIERLFERLNEIGWKPSGVDSLVTGQQQLLLLRHLKTTESTDRPRQISLDDVRATSTLEELNGLLTQAMARPQDIQSLIRGDRLEALVAHVLHLNCDGASELLAAAALGRIANVARGQRAAKVLWRAFS